MDEELGSQKFRIGDLVLVNSIIRFEYEPDHLYSNRIAEKVYVPKRVEGKVRKILYRYKIEPEYGIIIGWTVKRAGNLLPSDSDYVQSSLMSEAEDYHKVWLVELLSPDQRYHKPYDCLEEDLHLELSPLQGI